MIRRYVLLWHVGPDVMAISEGEDGHFWESAETEAETEQEAQDKLQEWVKQRMKSCSNSNCEHTGFGMNELTPNIIMSGMTRGMVKI